MSKVYNLYVEKSFTGLIHRRRVLLYADVAPEH